MTKPKPQLRDELAKELTDKFGDFGYSDNIPIDTQIADFILDRDKSRDQALANIMEIALHSHDYCEDPWYSCQLAENGLKPDDGSPPVCTCGANNINEQIRNAFKSISDKKDGA